MPKGVVVQDEKVMERFRTVVQNALPFSLKINKNISVFSQLILSKTKSNVSVSTLKRLFLYPDSTTPSQYTLDLICKTIGLSGWNEFLENENQIVKYMHFEIMTTIKINGYKDFEEFGRIINENASSPHIFDIILTLVREAVKKKDNETLSGLFNISFFSQVVNNYPAQFYFEQEFGLLMREYSEIDQLVEHFAKNPNAQRWYIEHFVDEDYLDGYYGKMMEIYHQHKKTNEALLFYHSLMCQHDIENGNFNSKHYDFLLQFRETQSVHFIPNFRRLALLIIYFHNDKEIKDSLLEEIPLITNNLNVGDRSFLALIFCQIVFLKGDFYAIKSLFEYMHLKQDISIEEIHLYRNFNVLKIYKAYVLYHENKIQEAENILKSYNNKNPFRQNLFDKHSSIVNALIREAIEKN